MSAGHCYLKALSHSPSIYTEYYRLNWSHSFEHTSSYATEMNDVSCLSSENEVGICGRFLIDLLIIQSALCVLHRSKVLFTFR